MITLKKLLFFTFGLIFALNTVDQDVLFANQTVRAKNISNEFSNLIHEAAYQAGVNNGILKRSNPASLEFVEVSGNVMRAINPDFVDADGNMKFKMGSPKREVGRGFEDQVDVTLTKSFFLAKTPITQLQYFLLTGEEPVMADRVDTEAEDYLALRSRYQNPGEINIVEMNANRPVVGLSWDEVNKLLNVLNGNIKKQKSKIKGELIFRVPTEAEYEYAVRAGTTGSYYFGSKPIEDYAVYDGNMPVINHWPEPVGTKPPNPLGLFDMVGNASTFCVDLFCEELPGGIDPVVTDVDTDPVRVVRGGSFKTCRDKLRSAARMAEDSWPNAVGVRLVLEIK